MFGIPVPLPPPPPTLNESKSVWLWSCNVLGIRTESRVAILITTVQQWSISVFKRLLLPWWGIIFCSLFQQFFIIFSVQWLQTLLCFFLFPKENPLYATSSSFITDRLLMAVILSCISTFFLSWSSVLSLFREELYDFIFEFCTTPVWPRERLPSTSTGNQWD